MVTKSMYLSKYFAFLFCICFSVGLFSIVLIAALGEQIFISRFDFIEGLLASFAGLLLLCVLAYCASFLLIRSKSDSLIVYTPFKRKKFQYNEIKYCYLAFRTDFIPSWYWRPKTGIKNKLITGKKFTKENIELECVNSMAIVLTIDQILKFQGKGEFRFSNFNLRKDNRRIIAVELPYKKSVENFLFKNLEIEVYTCREVYAIYKEEIQSIVNTYGYKLNIME